MGAGGKANHNTETIVSRNLKRTGNPNSKIQRVNSRGILAQERWYDAQGHAIRNRDFSHGGDEKFPHDHAWVWHGEGGYRLKEHLEPDYEHYN